MNAASPMADAHAARLSPRQKADIILHAAQADMAQHLWRMAMGEAGGADAGDTRSTASAGHRAESALTLDAVLATLGIGDRAPVPAMPSAADHAPPVADSRVASPAPPATVTGLGANEPHRAALATASARTGIAQGAIAAIIDAEAGRGANGAWNVQSRNPRSSAAGLGQFLSGTWIGMAQQRGTWLHDRAVRQGWLDTQGRVRADARSALLALRDDAAASIETVADYARFNIARLRSVGVAIGPDVRATAQAAYIGHHLGSGDAVKFLRGTMDGARAERLLSAQVGAPHAQRLIAGAGDAVQAHRDWLTRYVARNVRPERFGAFA